MAINPWTDILDALREDLKHKQRSIAWSRMDVNSIPTPLRSAIKQHVALAKRIESFKKRHRRPRKSTSNPSGLGKLCQCGKYWAEHSDRAVMRRHMWVIRLKHFIKKDWTEKWPKLNPDGSLSSRRRSRMMKAWAARRAKKDQRLLAVIHPRVRTLIGDEELLRRLGRRPELNAK